MNFKRSGIFLLTAALLLAGSLAAAATLDEVRKAGILRCGVNGAVPGMSEKTEDGQWRGLDADFCRAVAAAALGDAKKVDFVPLSNDERLAALKDKRVDVLARNTTWTLQRDTRNGMLFAGVLYYDGQGLMLPKSRGLHSVLQANGLSVCAQADTTSVDNSRGYFARHRMTLKLTPVGSLDEMRSAYLAGVCDAVTSDQSQLYALRRSLNDPAAHAILPEVLSKEPLSVAVSKDDPQWLDVVRWTLFTLLDAEELGIDSVNVVQARDKAENPAVRRFLGAEGNSGDGMGLDADWAYNVVSQVGNYAELFDRNLKPLGIKRGLNALWRNGGLHYAPPIR